MMVIIVGRPRSRGLLHFANRLFRVWKYEYFDLIVDRNLANRVLLDHREHEYTLTETGLIFLRDHQDMMLSEVYARGSDSLDMAEFVILRSKDLTS
jgi:hypothetical protein